MPTIEIEVGEDGALAKVPEAVQKLIDKAYGQGQAKAADAEAAAKKLQGEIDALKKGALNPAEREKLTTLEAEQSKLREELAMRDKNFEEAQRIRDERHAKELSEREARVAASQAEIEKRTQRIRELVGKEIRAYAIAEGARQESLGELEVLLGTRVGLDDGLQAFVTDAKEPGKALLDKDGKPVTVEGFVRQYLTDHPHHKAAPGGRGGGARGGQSLRQGGSTSEPALAAAEAARDDPSKHNVRSAWAEVNKLAGA